MPWTLQIDPGVPIPGGFNGLAAASPVPGRIEVFATTAVGIIQYSFVGGQPLPPNPPLPESGGLPTRLLAAVSSTPGTLDVFAVEPNLGMPLRWHFDGAWPRLSSAFPVCTATVGWPRSWSRPGSIELFGIRGDASLWSGSVQGAGAIPRFLPAPPIPLPEGTPAAVAVTATSTSSPSPRAGRSCTGVAR